MKLEDVRQMSSCLSRESASSQSSAEEEIRTERRDGRARMKRSLRESAESSAMAEGVLAGVSGCIQEEYGVTGEFKGEQPTPHRSSVTPSSATARLESVRCEDGDVRRELVVNARENSRVVAVENPEKGERRNKRASAGISRGRNVPGLQERRHLELMKDEIEERSPSSRVYSGRRATRNPDFVERSVGSERL